MRKRQTEKAVFLMAIVILGICYSTKWTGTEPTDDGAYYNIRAEPEEVVEELSPVDIVPVTMDKSFDAEEVLPTEEYISLGDFEVTAYSLTEGSSCGHTKSGTVPQLNYTVAVDPEVIPLGSIIVIDGVDYVAEDIGGLVKGKVVDIYVESTESALEYGRQEHEVFIKRNTP